MSKLYYSLFILVLILNIYILVLISTILWKQLFLLVSLFFSSPLVLISTAFYKMYHFDTEMAHLCRCAIKPY